MTRRRPFLGLLLGLLALFLAAAPAEADRETAEFFAKRGDRLLQGGDAGGAAEQYRRSIAEDDTFLPAHVGLGEALVAEGRAPEAGAEFRAAVALAAKAKALPPAWADAVARAKKRLAEVDVPGTTLERVQQNYADALVAVADRWKSKDPVLAERALRLALEAAPGHAGATARLASLGRVVGKGTFVVLDGKAFDGFTPKEDDELWKITGGILRGGLAGKARSLHTERIFDADVDVRMEARVAALLGKSPKVGVMAACGTHKEGLFFGIFEDVVVLDHETGSGSTQNLWTALRRNVKPTFEASEWTKYEIRLREDEVALLINGNLVRKERRPKERRGGVAGVYVQDAIVEVRVFEVVLH